MSSWDVFPKRFILIPDVLTFSCLIPCDYLHKKVKWKVRLTESEIGNDSEIENEKKMKLASKRSKFNSKLNWKINSNVLMPIQWTSVLGSAGKSPKFTFHLIKDDALTQTRTCLFSWFSSELCESAILNFYSHICTAVQCCHIVLLAQI